jgi:hypothetical protein
VKRETALGLYKGLGAVLTGIVPKMATRFTSYEWYKQMLADKDGNVSSKSTFLGKFTALLLLGIQGSKRLYGLSGREEVLQFTQTLLTKISWSVRRCY